MNAKNLQVAILGSVSVIVLVIFVYGVLYALGFVSVSSESDTSGEEFIELDREPTSGPIQVIEFFSYECPACERIDPTMEELRESLPDTVEFRRVHVTFSSRQRLLARAHIALSHHKAMQRNHGRIFRAIHDRNKRFMTDESMGDFVDGFGIEKDTLVGTMSGSRVEEIMRKNRSLVEEVDVLSIPTLLVGDKYVMNTSLPRSKLIDATLKLVAKLTAEKDMNAQPSGEKTETEDGSPDE